MTTPRLASSVLVSALRQRAEAQGGFAAVLQKGDATSGSIMIVLVEPGGEERIFERILQPNGTYGWREVGNRDVGDPSDQVKFLERRRRFDPDMWLIELNVASAERFTAELGTFD